MNNFLTAEDLVRDIVALFWHTCGEICVPISRL